MKPLKHEEHARGRCQNNLHEALMIIILSLEFSVFFAAIKRSDIS